MSDPVGTRRGARKADGTRSGAVGGSFNPISLVGSLGGFWRADIGVSVSGSTVTNWADQSALANDLTGNGGFTSPTWTSTQFNGTKPGVHFTTASGWIRSAGIALNTTTLSCFALLTSTGAASGNSRWMRLYNTSNSNDFNTPAFEFDGGTGGVTSFECYSGGIQGNGGGIVPYSANTPLSPGVIFDGAHANVYKNFAVVGSGTTYSLAIGDPTSTRNLFGLGESASAPSDTIDVAWLLLTNTAITGGNITSLKNWTNSNWGTSF